MNFLFRLAAFWQRRHGQDTLNRVLCWAGVLWMFAGALFRVFAYGKSAPAALLFYLAFLLPSVLLLCYAAFRYLSSNGAARRREEAGFLAVWKTVCRLTTAPFRRYRHPKFLLRVCPACQAGLRLPYTRAARVAVCPRCGKRFEVSGDSRKR